MKQMFVIAVLLVGGIALLPAFGRYSPPPMAQTRPPLDQRLRDLETTVAALRREVTAGTQYIFLPHGAKCPTGWTYGSTMLFYVKTSDFPGAFGGGAKANGDVWGSTTHPVVCKRN